MGLTVAYLGPAGTYSEEALLASAPPGTEPEPRATMHETVMAVQRGEVDRAVVPIENSLEGGVAATLDALAGEASGVRISGEVEHEIHHHLIAAGPLALGEVTRVLSHPQATAQCSAFIREHLAGAKVVAATSTAEAVRTVRESDGAWAALGSKLSAELYDATVLAERVEDRDDNVTRFVWLAPAADADPGEGVALKTSIVFWGFPDGAPGALVDVLGEISGRGINLTKIESRPRRVALGRYMFFADLEGGERESHVAEALDALRARLETVRVLGSYPSWSGQVR